MTGPYLSRRNLLLASVGTSLSLLLHSEAQVAPPALSVNLLGHHHELFEPLLADNYPGVMSSHRYSQIKPFMAILQNNHTLRAIAYSVEWVITDQTSGRQRRLLAHFMSKHRYRLHTARFLEPNSIRLVSPFFNASPIEFAQWTQHLHGHIPDNFPFFNAPLESVHLDLAIFSDGTFAGPDRNKFRERYIAQRNAEHHEGVSVMQHLEANSDLSQINALLSKHVKHAASAQGGTPQAIYDRARGQEALILQHVLSTQGGDALRADVARRSSFRRDVLRDGNPT